MFVITITKWRKKLVLLLAAAVFLVSLGLGISWYLSPADNPTVAPSDNLQKDIQTQPVKVQGQPATSNDSNAKAVPPQVKSK